MTIRAIAIAGVLAVAGAATMSGEQTAAVPAAAAVQGTAAAVPVMSDVDQLRLINASQRVEIAQLKVQAAQAEFVSARDDFSKQIQAAQREGFDLNPQTLTYVRKSPAKTKQ